MKIMINSMVKTLSRLSRVGWLLVLLSVTHLVQAQDVSDLLTSDTAPKSTSEPDKVIDVDHSKQNDRKIEKRLRQIFSEMDDLKDVKASVSNGVVILQGMVDSNAAENKAIDFAKQIENVVEVENRLIVSYSLKKRLQKTMVKMTALGEQLIAGLPLFLLALLVIILFWILGGWTSKRQGFFRRISINFFISDLLGKLTHLIFIVVGIVFALNLLDATALLGTILGAAGIFGLAVGFAVRDTVENFIASILLSIRNPFEVNEFVDIDGQQGNVARLTSRATILISPDGNHIRIPNSTVYKAVITNFTRNPERRFQFDLGIATDQDLSKAQSLALATLKKVPGILSEPKPQAIIHELGDSNVVIRIFNWVNQGDYDLLKVRSEAIKSVKKAFDEEKIIMPNPIYDLRLSHEKDRVSEEFHEKTEPAIPVSAHDIDLQSDEVKDITADHTVEKQVAKENVKSSTENLLDPNAPE
ncbi:MAG: mechanosensitive ion channel family protein [Methylobacter sp.]|uniref:mechanosensitive ion channel family protein n=1 Tax=Methylobacter sp. TaxID=2051955 RepID=UPI0025854A8D|nr:mechanosensitive ion channel family protein [Methylobacter sp.]MCL7421990.1 mechanosensitive ion channel family protein [Methylobacter sp.]